MLKKSKKQNPQGCFNRNYLNQLFCYSISVLMIKYPCSIHLNSSCLVKCIGFAKRKTCSSAFSMKLYQSLDFFRGEPQWSGNKL